MPTRDIGWWQLLGAGEAGSPRPGAQQCGGIPLDITSDEEVAALAEHLSSTGGLDGVVNNAGGALGLDRVEDGDVDGWRWMYELNVLGTLRVTKAMLLLLRAAAGGDIVVVTSTAAYEAYEGGAGYTGSSMPSACCPPRSAKRSWANRSGSSRSPPAPSPQRSSA
ncbi:SDR family NAD(P)-dependent oxidoreductase [Nesterenkonia pannonica]|uniref:SDR family oxidoreductase n=1 Tax=Nesterenkonia pannonica TaxID=1548602 RepID=UPI0021641C83|nr:SDR family NAD(P)-dependent oxidoreductase [Nesterenkonia pannonica]